MRKITPWFIPLTAVLTLILSSCGSAALPDKTSTPPNTPPSLAASKTKTPTPAQPQPTAQTPSFPSVCEKLVGEIKVQLVLPYAVEADLDPIAAGTIPLQIDPDNLHVQGQGHISYDETRTWTDDEGKETAEVFLELDLQLEGVCVEGSNGAELQLSLEANHLEEHGSNICAYPPGECVQSPIMGPEKQSFELALPLVDGAAVEREDWTSWTFVINLLQQ